MSESDSGSGGDKDPNPATNVMVQSRRLLSRVGHGSQDFLRAASEPHQ